MAVATAPPSARVIARLERINYAKRADRIVIRHGRGKVVAIIELVSPGNKESRHALRTFVEKAADILTQGIHLLIVDLFPPTPRDPLGLHKAVWDEFADEPFDFLPDRPFTVASYVGGDIPTAYVESVGVGDPLPSMPVFLTAGTYVPCPLEATYMQAWAVFPEFLKGVDGGPARPSPPSLGAATAEEEMTAPRGINVRRPKPKLTPASTWPASARPLSRASTIAARPLPWRGPAASTAEPKRI